ncbi:hypothetical protein [Neisseria chenwenguii]|uniref:Uncharacterized protein n=1 Tax=Neisseria chenwenguii TaxID=1853278 RepID=A0A220S0Z9_9NEIS|nr:hypothetical protein [Neisseria chenwenguii]ASK27170.1 hypothetical protein BG910_04930 [Neisseria chenwenguii]ROV56569.1 hypothetical protein EGS38_04115 [Neisseria chenwenguii]
MTFVTKLLLWMLLLSMATLVLTGIFGNAQESSLAPIAGLCAGLSFWALIIKLLIDRPSSVRIEK